MGPSELLLAYGGRLLLEHSHCLVALLDQSGQLLAWNAALGQLLALTAGDNITQLLDQHSGLRLQHLLAQARVEHAAGPIMLHFVESATSLPRSYRCRTIRVPEGQVVMLAEPLAPLDQQSAEQYMLVTNELALTTRHLEKTRYALEQKQRQLEQALSQIEELAHTDELTRLLNRRSLMLRLSEETSRAKRYHLPCAVLLIDIDHFKQVNDRYGHPAGDLVLAMTAELLLSSIRSTDHLGRYGGEEFLAILPMTGATAAAELAERLRKRVENKRFTLAETVEFSITVSIGAAEFDPEQDDGLSLVSHADNALYLAKAQGRNRCRVWGAPEGQATG
jgi:diguanylate cyclase (GGDEF)-like protein